MSESSSFASSVAGPSSPQTSRYTPPPPPDAIQRDDYAAADQARQRFSKRGLLSSVSLPHLGRSPSKSSKRSSAVSFPALLDAEADLCTATDVPDLVALSDDPNLSAEVDEDYDKDVYRWATLYENQRGATVFSTPYYSPLTLLPLDPPPFTIPTATHSPRKNQPTVTLEDYPLPDGSWKWVSRAWMIDMRGDGQVQYDGFEYSRSFRSRHWSPSPGVLSNRGLVRRRRWIRLMMRPAHAQHEADGDLDAPHTLPSTLPEFEHNEEGATRPPSVVLTISDSSDGTEVWRGDTDDWERCHTALRHLGRDGRKLELWARWLGLPEGMPPSPPVSWDPTVAPYLKVTPPDSVDENPLPSNDSPSPEDLVRSIEDSGTSISPAAKEDVRAVVRVHGSELLALFVYPDSRAKFLSLLGRAGLLTELRAGIGVSESTQFLDFWSYVRDMDNDVDTTHT